MAFIEFENVTRYDSQDPVVPCFLFGSDFEGRGKYKPGFALGLEDSMAEDMAEDGWNIKIWQPKDDDGNPDPERKGIYYLPVEVRFDKKPPRLYIIGSSTKILTEITEQNRKDIDDIINERERLEYADITISASRWKDDYGNWRIKAYLSAIRVWFKESRFDMKYAEYGTAPADPDIPF